MSQNPKVSDSAASGGGRKYPPGDVKILWGFAAARCAFPGCRDECVEAATGLDKAVILGKIAHIVAHGDQGPRADSKLPPELRDRYENWVLLCGPHHDIVDHQENTYTVEELHRWKAEHETWVRERLSVEMPQVGFAELEIVTKGILNASISGDVNFQLTSPREKMKRNSLSERMGIYFTMGLSKAKEVAAFVDHVAIVDSHFPDQLKAGFVLKYEDLKKQGIEGDALFETLHDFAGGAGRDFKRQAAGLAVLLYLFEKCEVFEP